MSRIDPLMTRLAEALRGSLEYSAALYPNIHAQRQKARAALAAYDERAASLAAPEPEPRAFKPGDRVVLARPDASDIQAGVVKSHVGTFEKQIVDGGYVVFEGRAYPVFVHLHQLEPEGDPIPLPTDPALLSRLEALEAAVASLTAPAEAAPSDGVPVTPVARPSVGRRVRSLRGADWHTSVISDVAVGRFRTVDGKDQDGDYWIDGINCIGKPGIDFEFID